LEGTASKNGENLLVLGLFSVDSASRIPETFSRRYDNPQYNELLGLCELSTVEKTSLHTWHCEASAFSAVFVAVS